jgi:hypothetical protein
VRDGYANLDHTRSLDLAAIRRVNQIHRPCRDVRLAPHTTLRARARLIRHLHRPRPVGLFEDGIPTKTYPDGYDTATIGPSSAGPGRP